MKAPNIFYIDNLLKQIESTSACVKAPDGSERWVPARPIGYYSFRLRIKAAWLVLTGNADALLWRDQ